MNNNETTTASTPDADKVATGRPAKLLRLAAVLIATIAFLCGCSADINAAAESILREGIPEHFEKNGLGGYLKVVDVEDVAMIKVSGNTYKGLANVTFKTARGEKASKTIQYDLSGTFDGNQLLLEFKWSDSEDDNMEELFKKAGYSE